MLKKSPRLFDDVARVSSVGSIQQPDGDSKRAETEFCGDSRSRRVTDQRHCRQLQMEQFQSFHHDTG